jgi:hypothetical protein
VLDLPNESQDIWTIDYMAMAYACSREDMTEQQAANHDPGMVAKQPLRLFVDICIQDLFFPDEFQAHHLWWVQNRKIYPSYAEKPTY